MWPLDILDPLLLQRAWRFLQEHRWGGFVVAGRAPLLTMTWCVLDNSK